MTEERAPGALFGARHRLLTIPLGVYLASRVLQILVLWWMAPDGEVRGRLLSWDAGHFIRLVEEGYPSGYSYDEQGRMVGNGLAFFPGYPLTVRLVDLLTPFGAASAALIVSWVAGAFAAVLVYRLGTRLYDERVGLALTVLFCVQPMSMALSMAYSESLFTALVAGMLVLAHDRRWLAAGAVGLAAALSRPTGAAAAIALAVAALIAVHREAGPKWRPLAAAAAALAGVPAYLTWVALRIGDPDAWFAIQTAGWGSTFDYGASTLSFVGDALRDGDSWIQVSIAWLLVAAVISAAAAVVVRVWPPLLVYGLIALVLVLGQAGYYHSKPRLFVPVLLVLVPPAIALGRARPRTAALLLGGLAAFGLWYGAYMITVFRYAI